VKAINDFYGDIHRRRKCRRQSAFCGLKTAWSRARAMPRAFAVANVPPRRNL
jgi:hypothetical protein